jgi:hypothetical protein
MDLHHQLNNFQYIFSRLQSSVGAFTSGVTGGNIEPAPKKSKAQRKRLEGQLRTDAEELTGHIESTVLLMLRLQEGERHVEEVGNALHNSLQAMSSALRRNGFKPDDDGLMHTSVPLIPTPSAHSEESDAAGSPMADELANFCDAVGSFKIMRERIGELHSEKQEQEERKDLLGDQELKLDRGSEEFLLGWHQSLADAEKDYEEAEAAVRHAREVCEAAGISIPPWAEADPVFDEGYEENIDAAQSATLSPPVSIMPQESSGHVAGSSTNSSEVFVVNESSQMSNSPKIFESLNNATASGDKVARWIEDVQPDVPDQHPGLLPIPAHKSNTSIPNAHGLEHHTVEPIHRMRSRSSPPFATRPKSTSKSPASCISTINIARNSEQMIIELQPEVMTLVASTPVQNPDARQCDDDITELPPFS